MSSTVSTDPVKQRLILLSISFASFMVNLDTYIVNISLPGIAHYFKAGANEVSWVVLGYNLTVASLLIIIGRIGDRLGLKRIFMVGFGLFTISSLICGCAPFMIVLILGRCIQGVGASMLYAMTPAMVPKFLPENMRGPAFGTLATAAALGITVGTPLGGIITGLSSWHWIFLINIPVGIVAMLVCRRVIPNEPKESRATGETGFDIPGAMLSFICSLSFIYGLSMGDQRGWTSPLIIGCFIAAAVSLYGFIYWEGRAKYPLLDLSLFRDRAFTFGNSAGILAFAFLAGNNFLMPFYLMLVKGLKAEYAGMVFLIYSVIYMFVGPIAGLLTRRVSARLLCTLAMALCALNAGLFSFLLEAPTLIPVIIYFVFMAFSYGTFCTANNTVVMGMAPPGKQGVVSGTYRMGNRLGMACGVCYFAAVFSLAVLTSDPHAAKVYSELPRAILLTGFRGAYIGGACVLLLSLLFSAFARSRTAGDEGQSGAPAAAK
jgi:EmrB/QacA subfamily drug resistance transporter